MRFRALLVAFLALCLGVLTACGNGPATAASREQMTYDEMIGTGLANKCPEVASLTRGSIPIEPNKSYEVSDLCLEPQQFFVKEESTNKRREAEFVPGKLLTRDTTSLEQIRGTITADNDGTLTLAEKDGMDFQAITLQLPGGERVPFFFTVKNFTGKSGSGFTAINSSVDFEGNFKVPSYRGAGFLDPKGRGAATGYDNAVALPPAADESEYARTNAKQTETGQGELSLQITKVDGETGEVGGVFVSEQPSDTDLGARDPLEVKTRGIFYARIEPEA